MLTDFLVQIGPPSSRFLPSKDKTTWAAKDVADCVLSDKSSLVIISCVNANKMCLCFCPEQSQIILISEDIESLICFYKLVYLKSKVQPKADILF
jgi:hypothetical protein